MGIPFNFIKQLILLIKQSGEKKRVLDFFKRHAHDNKNYSIFMISSDIRMSEDKVFKYCELLWEGKKIDKQHILGAIVPNNLLPQYRLANPTVI